MDACQLSFLVPQTADSGEINLSLGLPLHKVEISAFCTENILGLIMNSSCSLAEESAQSNCRVYKMKKFVAGDELFQCFKNGDFCDVVLNADDGQRF